MGQLVVRRHTEATGDKDRRVQTHNNVAVRDSMGVVEPDSKCWLEPPGTGGELAGRAPLCCRQAAARALLGGRAECRRRAAHSWVGRWRPHLPRRSAPRGDRLEGGAACRRTWRPALAGSRARVVAAGVKWSELLGPVSRWANRERPTFLEEGGWGRGFILRA
jgi:hypothetical protein